METTNYVTYKIQNFLSDIGGLVGLFLGLSILSVFEFILVAANLTKKFLLKKSLTSVEEGIIIVKPAKNNQILNLNFINNS